MKKVVVAALAALVALASCGQVDDYLQGALILTVAPNPDASKTLEPTLDMAIDTYDVTGAGPDGATFEQLGLASDTVTVVENSLAIGAWVVTVEAKNAGGTTIGSGSVAVAIEAAQVAEAEVVVTPVPGTGTLDLDVTWPVDTVGAPSVAGSLTPQGGDATGIPFTLAIDELSASYTGGWDAGYYTLVVQLLDGGTVVWGAVEAVRIVAGGTTPGLFELTGDDLTLTGSLDLVISPDMRDPIEITFSGQQSTLAVGTDMTVTATPSETVDSYQWYLNGDMLTDETLEAITIGGALEEGNYRLDVVVGKTSVLSSQTHPFAITAATGILVPDYGNDRIVRIDDMSGTGWTTYGTSGSGTHQFDGPVAAVLGPDAKLYFVDYGLGRIVRVDDMTGTNWISFGTSGSGTDQFNIAYDLAFDSSGRIYVGDGGNNRIVRFDDMTGTNWTTFGTSGSGVNQFTGSHRLCIDSSDRIYITDQGNNRIVRIDDMSGTNWVTFGTSGSGVSQFQVPQSPVLDGTGRLYIADRNNHRIVRVDDMTGANWTTFGSNGSGVNQFDYPNGLSVGPGGHIYIADSYNARLVEIADMSGTGWTTYGTSGSGDHQFGSVSPPSVFAF